MSTWTASHMRALAADPTFRLLLRAHYRRPYDYGVRQAMHDCTLEATGDDLAAQALPSILRWGILAPDRDGNRLTRTKRRAAIDTWRIMMMLDIAVLGREAAREILPV